ncbi:Dyp-type peroxidase [Allosphingosinicella sp.]|uniref:Dyp-type peroxidase n=1 Tax=Allosphingosinicella sp. TaxID=2823234 RepID=UPI002F1B3DF2
MQSLITIAAQVWEAHVPAIQGMIDAMKNPARPDLRAALDKTDPDGSGTHFMSLHAIPDGDGSGCGHIILEFTADGDEIRAVDRIAQAIGAELLPIFRHARDWRDNVGLADYLKNHRIKVGAGLFDLPGLCFAGTPGMTVDRIRQEARLAKFVGDRLEDGGCDVRPIDRVAKVRRAVEESEFAWALEPPPPPGRDANELGTLSLILGHPFLKALLALLGAIAGTVFFVTWVRTDNLGDAGEALLWAVIILAVLTIIVLGLFYSALRKQEDNDWCDPRAPAAETLKQMRERENHCAQNHMISVTVRKPGFVRWVTIRLIFSVIGLLATRSYRPGFLGGISTIHAARWITVPGTRNLIFFSNFGGSWESYLEDFITRAHDGLTGVWSNSIGFPRAKNLIQDGATDGERFKRYARASMLPTLFWYSAYPDLVTDHIRHNADIRRGLAAGLTGDEAAQWLSLFGSAPRPDSKLETNQIQSLVFGGLGFMKDGWCVLYNLPEDRERARAFMASIYPRIGFGDGRRLRHPAVLQVALGPRALERLGLPDECVKGFPPAFLEGMSTQGRARVLGDIGSNAPEHWEWGKDPYDVALLIYGYNAGAVASLDRRVREIAEENGMGDPHRVELARTKKPAIEPFGFVDGVSQPIIRGTYQSIRNSDPIHLVEPGEFIIGYPDNRGNLPPEPELAPLADPENRLPVSEKSREFGNTIVEAPRSIGRNGTFLVIRQLEQDVEGFWSYCRAEAERLKPRLPVPYDVNSDYIAAKLVGRWCDGSSLVRNPYYRHSVDRKRLAHKDDREVGDLCGDPATAQRADEDKDHGTSRPMTNPEGQTPILPPTEPSVNVDNDFLYGVEDPQALRCPFGAHIRRANPRDSLKPGSMDQVSISNRHRILRVGRLYEPKQGRSPGLMFMCLNGDIERQFEFIQQTWLVTPSFHGLVGEQDPLTSNQDGSGFVVPTLDGPIRLKPLPQFVKTLGGGYFFMPGRSLMAFVGGV